MGLETGPLRTHHGICDASAGIFVASDSTEFFVADDEDQPKTKLRLYDTARDGPPLREATISRGFLKLDGDNQEIDLEGSAWLRDRIFWIGSHSRSKDGEPRPNRHRLFATRLRNGEAEPAGRPYTKLVADVRRELDLDLDADLPPKRGGLSIEGLSASENEGELLIGFRTPLIKRKALVVSLRNADEVVDRGAKAQFGEPILLDLDGLGIRSFEYWPERRSYLLIAGPTGESGEFRLLRWSGRISSRPEVLDGFRFDKLGVDEEASPEGLLIHRRSETVYVLFDEGKRKVGTKTCKDSDEKSFHSISVKGL